MKRLEPLIGRWRAEASVDGVVLARGHMTNEWIEDGAFLRRTDDGEAEQDAPEAWHSNNPFPTIALVGIDDEDGTFGYLYSDGRGVRRVYEMTMEDGLWRISRAAPGFHQRFTGQLAQDGSEIEGRWEASPDGSEWSLDFELLYRRAQE